LKNLVEDQLNAIAWVFGNNEYRNLGKEKSVWFKKIYENVEEGVPGFLEFVLAAELQHGKLVSKEELVPTTSLLLKKHIKKQKEKRRQILDDFFNGDEFDGYCKSIFNMIKENMSNGSN